jgi:hypothetical protein
LCLSRRASCSHTPSQNKHTKQARAHAMHARTHLRTGAQCARRRLTSESVLSHKASTYTVMAAVVMVMVLRGVGSILRASDMPCDRPPRTDGCAQKEHAGAAGSIESSRRTHVHACIVYTCMQLLPRNDNAHQPSTTRQSQDVSPTSDEQLRLVGLADDSELRLTENRGLADDSSITCVWGLRYSV